MGAGAAFLILGLAAVSWRTQCAANPSAGICFVSAPAERAAPAPAQPEAVAPIPAEPAVEAPELVAAAVVPAEEPSLPAVSEATLNVATVSEPVPAAVMATPEPVPVAAMMASTFETLDALRAQINGPQALKSSALAAAAAPAQPAAAATPAKLPTPAPLTARTVSVISVTPEQAMGQLPRATGAPSSAVAAIAAAQPRAVAPNDDTEVAAITPDPAAQPLAFATASVPTPDAEADDRRTITVAGNRVNVRFGPSTNERRLFVLDAGAELKGLAVAGGWVEIEDERGRTGWVSAEFLEAPDLSGLPVRELTEAESAALEPEAAAEADDVDVAATAPSGSQRTVLGAGVNVRSGPSTSSERLFALPGGEKVTVTAEERGWLNVTDDRGRTGWLYQSYVSGS